MKFPMPPWASMRFMPDDDATFTHYAILGARGYLCMANVTSHHTPLDSGVGVCMGNVTVVHETFDVQNCSVHNGTIVDVDALLDDQFTVGETQCVLQCILLPPPKPTKAAAAAAAAAPPPPPPPQPPTTTTTTSTTTTVPQGILVLQWYRKVF